MASQGMIVWTLFVVVGAVMVQAGPKCRENEEWMECGNCEGSCDNQNPICTRECKPAKCYCPSHKGFVRFGYTGKCIPASQCPVYENSKPKREAPGKTCGENEVWQTCGGCERLCDDGLRPCPLICHQECQCKSGFVRSWDKKCIKKDQCTLHPECASVSCPAGQTCIFMPQVCDAGKPCPQVTCATPFNFNFTDSPIVKRAVEAKQCGENERWTNCGGCEERCENPRGWKVMPCTLQCRMECQCVPGLIRGWDGKCIKKDQCTPHTDCADTKCPSGTRCVWDPKQCIVAPCPQVSCLAPDEH